MARRGKTAVTPKEETMTAVRTAIMVEKEIAAAVETAIIMETAAVVETVAIAGKALKVFKKRAIIATGEITATVPAKIFQKDSATNFNRKEKYIWINSNTAVFAWREKELAPAKAWRE